jgi:predicted O-methyltransferase YrrM
MTPRGISSEDEFRIALATASRATNGIAGHLTERDGHILSLLALCPMVAGEVVEIGSYKGRSTVRLATALKTTGEKKLHACDPFTAPGIPGQDLKTDDAVYAEFQKNLKTCEVADRVIVHRQLSTDLARDWRAPVRLLWVDGDHSYAGTTADFDAWSHFVPPGGFIAFHDALQLFPGPAQVFANRVLLDESWGACGICGSIGWAQRTHSADEARTFRDLKVGLYKKMSRVAALASLGAKIQGADKLRYKLLRTFIPHHPPTFEQFSNLTGYNRQMNRFSNFQSASIENHDGNDPHVK